MKKAPLLLLSLVLVIPILAQTIPIVPQPQSVRPLAGHFSLDGRHVLKWGAATGKVGQTARSLLQEWEKRTFPNRQTYSRNRTIILAGTVKDTVLTDQFLDGGKTLRELPPEGYRLRIQPRQILIIGKTEAGMLYGVQSLLQLLNAHHTEKRVPCVDILDYPAFEHRAVMDDISRGPLSNMTFCGNKFGACPR